MYFLHHLCYLLQRLLSHCSMCATCPNATVGIFAACAIFSTVIDIFLQHVRYLSCSNDSSPPKLTTTTIDEKINVQELEGIQSSSVYNICVSSANHGGSSDPLCKEFIIPTNAGTCILNVIIYLLLILIQTLQWVI